MKLNNKALKDRAAWDNAKIKIPEYDRTAMRENTKAAPIWAHFGAGNLFRAFPALCQQQLLEKGLCQKGIIAVDNSDMVDKIFRPHDELTLLVNFMTDGTLEKLVVGSIAESVKLLEDRERLNEIFCAPSLQMVSFTITEKGYRLTDADGIMTNDSAHDLVSPPDSAVSYMGRVASLLHLRYKNGAYPIAMVSMDNCSHNGDKLKDAILTFARAWDKDGMCEKGFLEYVDDPKRVSFPWSMIDKITPRPDTEVQKLLLEAGFEDVEGFITKRGTYVAPYVNAEKLQYLVIEEAFPGGRPPLESAGVLFTDRLTVERVERMKVCTCLNPSHTALAVFGCLLGYTKINAEMNDADLVRMVKRLGYDEGLPVVTDPVVLSPEKFFDEVITKRFPNPFLPDTPQRIACDTSQKIPVRFGETVKAYLTTPNADVKNLKMIPLVFAAWLRYLLGVDDKGEKMPISPDPMAKLLLESLGALNLSDQTQVHDVLKPILSNADIFGADLYLADIALRVEDDFASMLSGPGAVRETLKRRVWED